MNKNVLITGGSTGIGYEMALSLAGAGNRVVIAARGAEKSQRAIERIRAIHPQAQVESMPLDLGDFDAVDRFAKAFRKNFPVLDVLMLNAGLYTLKLHTLPNGYEAMIGIMHFGHFRLTQHLLPALKAAEQGRIVVTSSVGHQWGKIDEKSFTDPSRHLIGMRAYGQAKLANILFTRELAKRLQGTSVTVNAFHPGAVATEIWRETPGFFKSIALRFMLTPAQGADTAIWLATDPSLAGVSGKYFVKRQERRGTRASRDPKLAAELWRMSEQRMAQA
jgi:NAD(P)-dependent dehydrogenase (short-subunit alcohol dehydrogenase family)